MTRREWFGVLGFGLAALTGLAVKRLRARRAQADLDRAIVACEAAAWEVEISIRRPGTFAAAWAGEIGVNDERI